LRRGRLPWLEALCGTVVEVLLLLLLKLFPSFDFLVALVLYTETVFFSFFGKMALLVLIPSFDFVCPLPIFFSNTQAL
jgi:hypothetical protein